MKFGLLKPTCNINTVADGRGGIFTWVPKDDIKEFIRRKRDYVISPEKYKDKIIKE